MEIVIFYLKSYFAVWIGLFIHTGVEYNKTKSLFTKSNEAFTFKNFLTENAIGHLINASCCVLWMLIFRDIVNDHPNVKPWIWILASAAMGALNSIVWLYFFNAAGKRIMKIIDQKTNIADGK
jgi:hypothetical protein